MHWGEQNLKCEKNTWNQSDNTVELCDLVCPFLHRGSSLGRQDDVLPASKEGCVGILQIASQHASTKICSGAGSPSPSVQIRTTRLCCRLLLLVGGIWSSLLWQTAILNDFRKSMRCCRDWACQSIYVKSKISKKVLLSCGSEPDRMVERGQRQRSDLCWRRDSFLPEVRTCQQPESGPGAKSMKAIRVISSSLCFSWLWLGSRRGFVWMALLWKRMSRGSWRLVTLLDIDQQLTISCCDWQAL